MRDLTPFSDALIAAHRQRGRFAPAGPIPASLEEVYAVHGALIDSLGPAGGYKISRQPGQSAAIAPIPAFRCHDSGATLAVPEEVGVELEVGFTVTGPLPDPEAPGFRDALLGAVRPAAMIEIVASRLDGPAAEDPFAKLADLQACEGLVRGPAYASWHGTEFDRPEMTLAYAGETLFAGPGAVPGGSACDALEATARIVARHFGGLRPGQSVLTGALVPLRRVRRGAAVAGEIAGLGRVAAHL